MTSRVEITIPSADDFHHHFRDGEVLKDTVRHACRMFRRAVRYIEHLQLRLSSSVLSSLELGLLNHLSITPILDLISSEGGLHSVCQFLHMSANRLLQIAMPNLKPPVTTTDEALDYRQVSTHAVALAVCARAVFGARRCRIYIPC